MNILKAILWIFIALWSPRWALDEMDEEMYWKLIKRIRGAKQ